jgi:hypothetical protein
MCSYSAAELEAWLLHWRSWVKNRSAVPPLSILLGHYYGNRSFNEGGRTPESTRRRVNSTKGRGAAGACEGCQSTGSEGSQEALWILISPRVSWH